MLLTMKKQSQCLEDNMSTGYLPKLIELAGGEIFGRTRLQKLVYLLDQIGEESGFRYSYHHYGPYSEQLSKEIDIERWVKKSIIEEVRKRASDGAEYSVFKAAINDDFSHLAKLKKEKASSILSELNSQTSVVLELAATIHWLRSQEKLQDWEKELRVRKGSKIENGRAEKAKALLENIGL